MGGGHTPSSDQATIVERIDYSTDTSTAVAKGPLSEDSGRVSATGNSSSGYWSGGYNADSGTVRSYVRRIDFSNDTATGTTRGGLSVAKYYTMSASAAANALAARMRGVATNTANIRDIEAGPAFGYFTGGAYPSVSSEKSTIDRIDFSSDTSTASPKGNTSIARKNHGAAGNVSYGYNFGHFGPNSTTDRIDYANDTATAVSKGKLGEARGYTQAAGNNNFGYCAGGYIPSGDNRSSLVDRLDYSNDSSNCSSRGNLSDGRSSGSMTSNKNFGYLCGGKVPSVVSTVERIDYSNDTSTPITRGALSATRRYNSATGNKDYGYVGGNGNGGDTSVDRIDYSNDTATASPKGPFSAGANYRASTSTSTFGYFAGGQSPVKSTVDRIDYSSDTTTAVAKGPLSIAKNKSAGVSSREYGLPIGDIIYSTTVSSNQETLDIFSSGPAYGYFAAGP